MKKLLLNIIILLMALNMFSQNFNVIKDSQEKVFLKFNFIQTDFQKDGYCYLSDSLNWTEFINTKFAPKSDTTTKMYVFKSFFIVDSSLKNTDLSVFMGATNYPCYIYLNKVLIGRIGSYKELYSSQVHPYYEYILSPQLLKFGLKDTNELQIQAYPKFNEVIPLDRVFISSFKTVSTFTFWRNFFGPRFTQVVTIFAFILFLYFLTGFLLKRDRSDKKYLYFAFLCLFFALGYINMVFSWNVVPQLKILQISRSSLTLGNLFIVFFTMAFTKILDKKFYVKILLAIPQIIVIILVWLQNDVQKVENVVAAFVNILIPPYLLFAVTMAIIAFIKKPTRRNIIFLIGFCVFIATIIIDAVNYSSKLIPFTWYVIFGYFTIIFTIFFILAGEQTDIFHLSLDRADELEEMKTNLEQKVLQRTAELDKQKEELKVQAEVLQETNDLLREKNDELNNKNQEIEFKNLEISKKNNILTSQQNNIISSLQYASRIQTAVLPHQDFIENIIPENFVIFRPKDIVSGDFYFAKKVNQYLLLAVADCTGHGVPGAFMSMLGMALLNEIVIKSEIKTSGQVLNELRNQIKFALGQTGKLGEQQDGLDIAFVAINTETNIMQFSGANLPVFIFKNDKTVHEIKGDKMPIGVHPKDFISFTDHELPISKNDTIYLFTDGYYSQLGSKNNETLKIKRFRDFIYEINTLPLEIQKQKLIENLMSWKGKNEQTDDIMVFGIKY